MGKIDEIGLLTVIRCTRVPKEIRGSQSRWVR